MTARRILSLWFPRLGAERVLRLERDALEAPLAVVGVQSGTEVLTSLTALAEAEGLRVGQALRDAQAMCPGLRTRPQALRAEAAFLAALRRWAGRYSPWVAETPPASLVVDLTGCAHLFGGEAALLAGLEADCADLGLSVQMGLADTLGAAWALARYGGTRGGPEAARSGDAIDQEARATRSRAAKRRHWERGGAAPGIGTPVQSQSRIVPPGQTRTALAALPVAALRLDAADCAALNRLGLRRIGDLAGQPRAALARRFGRAVVLRLDQAFGTAPEPVSPAAPEPRFAVRLSLPEPIGLEADLIAGIDRLLPGLAARLSAAGRGARVVRLQALRCDHQAREIEVGLARPTAEPERIRPLLLLKLGAIDAGPGIDGLRLEAPVTEAVHARQHKGHLVAGQEAAARLRNPDGLVDLIGRLGARVGLEAVTRLHPADSHIPEKTAHVVAAAWSDPAPDWPAAATPRPLLIWRPESVEPLPVAPLSATPGAPGAAVSGAPPGAIVSGAPPGATATPLPGGFRWRRRAYACIAARGPERIAPEWWLDDPDWRSGPRDYWQVTTAEGERLWLYFAHGGAVSGGWFCQGVFA